MLHATACETSCVQTFPRSWLCGHGRQKGSSALTQCCEPCLSSAGPPLPISWMAWRSQDMTRAEIAASPLTGTTDVRLVHERALLRLLPRGDARILFDATDMALQQLSNGTRRGRRCHALNGRCAG